MSGTTVRAAAPPRRTEGWMVPSTTWGLGAALWEPHRPVSLGTVCSDYRGTFKKAQRVLGGGSISNLRKFWAKDPLFQENMLKVQVLKTKIK